MTIAPFGPFPSQFANAVQQNYLERLFLDPLLNKLAYRTVADREEFPARIGQSITMTRLGLLIPNTNPLLPSTNTNIDNGLTPNNYSDEQYTLSIAQIPQVVPDINLMDDERTIASFIMANAERLGVAQATGVDRIARQSLFDAYMSGNTVVTATLGAPGVTISVDDTRGYQTVVVNGNVTAVSSSNPLPVYINSDKNNPYQLIAFTNDSINTSSALITGGTSGTLTFSTNVSVLNGTAGNPVVSAFAPPILRPNNRTTTANIISSDLLNMTTLLAAVAYLRNNGVEEIDGKFNCFLNPTSMNQLFADPQFQILTRGATSRDPDYQNAWIADGFLDLRFYRTTETYVQPPQASAVPVTQTIQRPIICGKGALVEGIFSKGLDAIRNMSSNGFGQMTQTFNLMGMRAMTEGFYMYLRPPLDRLGQIISQTSDYVGGFTVPTDVTTTTQIIPTASNAYYKRCVVIETAS